MFSRTDFQVPANYTQQSHYDALKAGLIAAGWGNPIDEYTYSTSKEMVFKPLTTGAYKDRLHLRLELSSSNSVAVFINDGWNTREPYRPQRNAG